MYYFDRGVLTVTFAGSLRAHSSHTFKISKRLLSPARAAIKNAEELLKSMSLPQLTP